MNITGYILRSALLACVLFIYAIGTSHADTERVYITVNTLKKGKSVKDAEAYYKKLTPVFEKHGFKRLTGYTVNAKILGHPDINPTIVHVWKLTKPNPIRTIIVDPEFQGAKGLRESIFTMTKLQGWLATKIDK